uniref:Putative secreted protein n=1 Tax=Xenopsylla cheopis TaxID=163159 RepID=A0A6M2DZF8_XENCH
MALLTALFMAYCSLFNTKSQFTGSSVYFANIGTIVLLALSTYPLAHGAPAAICTNFTLFSLKNSLNASDVKQLPRSAISVRGTL